MDKFITRCNATNRIFVIPRNELPLSLCLSLFCPLRRRNSKVDSSSVNLLPVRAVVETFSLVGTGVLLAEQLSKQIKSLANCINAFIATRILFRWRAKVSSRIHFSLYISTAVFHRISTNTVTISTWLCLYTVQFSLVIYAILFKILLDIAFPIKSLRFVSPATASTNSLCDRSKYSVP